MTNIPANLTIKKLQKVAHCQTYIMMFKLNHNEKDYWQKLWLLNRYAESLGFKRKNSP